jgi:DNA polymerase-3 subunit alpha
VSDLVEKDATLIIEGRVTRDEQSTKILADSVVPIDKAEETWTASVHLNLDISNLDKGGLQRLLEILKQHRGSSTTFLHLLMPQRTDTVIALPDTIKVKASRDLTEAVNGFLGYPAVETTVQK